MVCAAARDHKPGRTLRTPHDSGSDAWTDGFEPPGALARGGSTRKTQDGDGADFPTSDSYARSLWAASLLDRTRKCRLARKAGGGTASLHTWKQRRENEAAENSSDGSAARRRTCAGRERPGEIGVPIMIRLLEISNHTLFWYYLASNLAYLTMLIVALNTSAAHQRSLKSHRLSWFKESPLAPPITIIAPAHNEEKSIRVAVRNLLELDYPQLEVIVVNDGSEDR